MSRIPTKIPSQDYELARALLSASPSKPDHRPYHQSSRPGMADSSAAMTPARSHIPSQRFSTSLSASQRRNLFSASSAGRSKLAAGSIQEQIERATARHKDSVSKLRALQEQLAASYREGPPTQRQALSSSLYSHDPNSGPAAEPDNDITVSHVPELNTSQGGSQVNPVTIAQLLSEIARLNEKLEAAERVIASERGLREEAEAQLNIARGERWAAEAAAETAIAAQRRAERRAAEIELSSHQLRQGQADANLQAERELSQQLEAERRLREALELRVEAAERAKRFAEDSLERECAAAYEKGRGSTQELMDLLEQERNTVASLRAEIDKVQQSADTMREEAEDAKAKLELANKELSTVHIGIGVLGTKMLEESRRIVTAVVVPTLLECNRAIVRLEAEIHRLPQAADTLSGSSELDGTSNSDANPLDTSHWSLPTALEVNVSMLNALLKRIQDAAQLIAYQNQQHLEDEATKAKLLESETSRVAEIERRHSEHLLELQAQIQKLTRDNATLSRSLQVANAKAQELERRDAELVAQLQLLHKTADENAFKANESTRAMQDLKAAFELELKLERERAKRAQDEVQSLVEASERRVRESVEQATNVYTEKIGDLEYELKVVKNELADMTAEKERLDKAVIDLKSELKESERRYRASEVQLEERTLQYSSLQKQLEEARKAYSSSESARIEAQSELARARARFEADLTAAQAEYESRLKAAEEAVRAKAVDFLEERGEIIQYSNRVKRENAEMQRDLEVLKVQQALQALNNVREEQDEAAEDEKDVTQELLHTPARSTQSRSARATPMSTKGKGVVIQLGSPKVASAAFVEDVYSSPTRGGKTARSTPSKGNAQMRSPACSASDFVQRLRQASQGLRSIQLANQLLDADD